MFTLLPGGSCSGLALRVPHEQVEALMPTLWAREMPNPVYDPKWLRADTAQGPVPALAFTLHPHSPNHTGRLSDAQYRKVKAEVERWRNAPGKYYDLDRRNCIHFVGAIAQIVGIKVEYPRSMLRKPRQWLDHVVGANPWLVRK